MDELSQALDFMNQNILAPPDYDNMCMICHDEMVPEDNNPRHKLECGHSYHANCIITWFRSGHNNCPYCGDKGVNYTPVPPGPRHYYGYHAQRIRLSKLRQFAKRNDAPPKFVKLYERFTNAENELNAIKREINNFKKNDEIHENISIKDVHKIMEDMKKRRSYMTGRFFKLRAEILDYPVIPLVIPKIQT